MVNFVQSLITAGLKHSEIVKILAAYDYSCLMCSLPDNLKEALRKYSFGKIQNDILYLPDKEQDKYGREDEFHITVKYGLKETNPELFQSYLKPAKVKLGPIGKFEQDDYDVLKVDVISEDLNSINEAVSKNFENTDEYPIYEPHITLAYVQKGKGDELIGEDAFKDEEFEIKDFYFTTPQEEKFKLAAYNKGKFLKKEYAIRTFIGDEEDSDSVDHANSLEEAKKDAIRFLEDIEEGRVEISEMEWRQYKNKRMRLNDKNDFIDFDEEDILIIIKKDGKITEEPVKKLDAKVKTKEKIGSAYWISPDGKAFNIRNEIDEPETHRWWIENNKDILKKYNVDIKKTDHGVKYTLLKAGWLRLWFSGDEAFVEFENDGGLKTAEMLIEQYVPKEGITLENGTKISWQDFIDNDFRIKAHKQITSLKRFHEFQHEVGDHHVKIEEKFKLAAKKYTYGKTIVLKPGKYKKIKVNEIDTFSETNESIDIAGTDAIRIQSINDDFYIGLQEKTDLSIKFKKEDIVGTYYDVVFWPKQKKEEFKLSSTLKRFHEFQHKVGDHHVKMKCGVCGNVSTCRCMAPKIEVIGICGECYDKQELVSKDPDYEYFLFLIDHTLEELRKMLETETDEHKLKIIKETIEDAEARGIKGKKRNDFDMVNIIHNGIKKQTIPNVNWEEFWEEFYKYIDFIKKIEDDVLLEEDRQELHEQLSEILGFGYRKNSRFNYDWAQKKFPDYSQTAELFDGEVVDYNWAARRAIDKLTEEEFKNSIVSFMNMGADPNSMTKEEKNYELVMLQEEFNRLNHILEDDVNMFNNEKGFDWVDDKNRQRIKDETKRRIAKLPKDIQKIKDRMAALGASPSTLRRKMNIELPMVMNKLRAHIKTIITSKMSNNEILKHLRSIKSDLASFNDIEEKEKKGLWSVQTEKEVDKLIKHFEKLEGNTKIKAVKDAEIKVGLFGYFDTEDEGGKDVDKFIEKMNKIGYDVYWIPTGDMSMFISISNNFDIDNIQHRKIVKELLKNKNLNSDFNKWELAEPEFYNPEENDEDLEGNMKIKAAGLFKVSFDVRSNSMSFDKTTVIQEIKRLAPLNKLELKIEDSMYKRHKTITVSGKKEDIIKFLEEVSHEEFIEDIQSIKGTDWSKTPEEGGPEHTIENLIKFLNEQGNDVSTRFGDYPAPVEANINKQIKALILQGKTNDYRGNVRSRIKADTSDDARTIFEILTQAPSKKAAKEWMQKFRGKYPDKVLDQFLSTIKEYGNPDVDLSFIERRLEGNPKMKANDVDVERLKKEKNRLELEQMNLTDEITELENTENRTREQTKILRNMGKRHETLETKIDEIRDKLDSLKGYEYKGDKRPFITDNGEEIELKLTDSTNKNAEKIRRLPRYAVWEFGKKGKNKHEVTECSNDLEYLKKKYNVTDEDVELVGELKESSIKINQTLFESNLNAKIKKLLLEGKTEDEIKKMLR